MSDHAELAPEQLHALLRSVEADPDLMADRREEIRAEMLDAFDLADAEEPASLDQVAPLEPPATGASSRWRSAPIAVAACVLLLIGVLFAVFSDSDESDVVETAAPTAVATSPPVLPEGPYSSDAIAGGVVFNIPAGLHLVEDSPGRIEFSALGTTDPEEPTVLVVETSVSASELTASIEGAVAAENLSATSSQAVSPGGPVTTWAVRLPPVFFVPGDCPATRDCFTVPVLTSLKDPPQLSQDFDSYMTIVELEGVNVLVVETDPPLGNPNAASTIVGSITLDR